MQPVYFLPNLTKEQLAPGERLDHSVLRARGIGDVFADCNYGDVLMNCPSGLGPGQHSGLYLCYLLPGTGAIPDRTGFYPDEQDWHQVGDGSQVWIGVSKASPPTPEDMVRKRTHHGYVVTLSNEDRWMVPVIRRPDDSTELPCDMIFDAAGNVVEPIKREYLGYWDETADVAEWFFSDQGFDHAAFSKSRALRLAVRALGINYRVGLHEQNALRMIDNQNWALVLAATVDVPKAAELTEKKSGDSLAAVPLNTLPGQSADSLATAPVAAT